MNSLLRPMLAASMLLAAEPWFASALAQDGGGLKVLGVKVEPIDGQYLVLKDVNVRAKPENGAKRVGRLSSGDKVEAVGRVKGPWLAVRAQGKMLGFVYAGILMPLIDGGLSDPVSGEVNVAVMGSCGYSIEFIGKSEAEPQRFEFADYGVEWRCKKTGAGAAEISFHTPMFLSEGPFQGTRSPVHQITVDVLELSGSLEEVFSTHLLWDRDAGVLKFDSATVKKFVRTKPPEPQSAKSLAGALKKAVETAAAVWTDAVWAALAKTPESR